jgi:hypothetical protein
MAQGREDGDEDRPTTAYLKGAWRPMHSVRDLTLSDQDLERACPLSTHRRRKRAKYCLGRLDTLPLEILNMMSCASLQQTNRRGYDMIHEMPQLKAIISTLS